MTFDNAISLLDAAAGRLVTLPGPIASMASAAGSTILHTEGDLPKTANIGDICFSQKDGNLYVFLGSSWSIVTSGAGE